MKKKNLLIITILICVISIIIGVFSKSGFFGTIALLVGFLNVFFMSQGKWYGYCLGILYSLLYAIISYFEVFYEPVQIIGLISWLKNKNQECVNTRALSKKQNIILFCLIIFCSFGFGYLLSLIKTQNLAFLDSTSQILNISANLLLMLRYKESWQVWVFGGTIDLIIWINCFINKGDYSFIMLIIACVYFVMNIYGYFNWKKIEKEQNK